MISQKPTGDDFLSGARGNTAYKYRHSSVLVVLVYPETILLLSLINALTSAKSKHLLTVHLIL